MSQWPFLSRVVVFRTPHWLSLAAQASGAYMVILLCHSCSIGVPWAASGWNWEGFVPMCSLLSFPSGGLPGFLDDESRWNDLTSAGHWGYCPLLDPAGPFLTSRAPCAACICLARRVRQKNEPRSGASGLPFSRIIAQSTWKHWLCFIRVFWKLSF